MALVVVLVAALVLACQRRSPAEEPQCLVALAGSVPDNAGAGEAIAPCRTATLRARLYFASMALDLPALRFPDQAWPQRFQSFVEGHRWRTPPRLNPGASPPDLDVASTRLGELPADLRVLLRSANGGQVGFNRLLPLPKVMEITPWLRGDTEPRDWAGAVPPGVTRSTLFALAEDGAGNYYACAPGGAHRVIYLCHDPLGWRHDFSSLGAFLDSTLLRALAAAEHGLAEEASGGYLDDARWTREVHELEARIDPGLLRTRED